MMKARGLKVLFFSLVIISAAGDYAWARNKHGIIEEDIKPESSKAAPVARGSASGAMSAGATSLEARTLFKNNKSVVVIRLEPPATEPGQPINLTPDSGSPAGSHLAVIEKELADEHKVEQNLSGNPKYVGQEVITRPSGRKVYRYFIGKPHREEKLNN